MNTCLQNVIGFTQTDCACFENLDDLNNESTSGLWMDELPESSHILDAIKSLADCGKTMVDHFTLARTRAISDFNEKLLEEIGSRYRVRQDPFSGLVGQLKVTATLNLTSTWIGAAYEMKPLKGGHLKLKRIFISLDESITGIPLQIWKAYQVGQIYELQEMIDEIAVDSVADVAHENILETPIFLPLADDSTHIVHYLFLMDRSDGWQPKNNAVTCGCTKQTLIEKWMIQAGIAGNDKEALLYSARKTGSSHSINGIVADVEIACGDVEFICENFNRSPYVKVAVEHAVLYQAVSNLLKSILRSNDLNRYTVTKREQMHTDAVILHNKFKSRIAWLAENMDLSTNTCYVCNTLNESHGPYKASILGPGIHSNGNKY